MGEARRKALAARRGAGDGPAEPLVVDTLGGRMHVRWGEGAAATPHGQLVFFAEFLAATGVFERWVSSCPLAYRSGNAPHKRDVLGTLMLGLLAGHRRYAHITALRADAVAAQALGRLLDELGDKAPAMVRGDSGYGNEGILLTLEERDQPYLLRLRQTKNVQRLVAQQFSRQDWSRPDNQGCQMVEASLQLHGWSKKRRVVIVRQRIRGGIARERRIDGKQLRLDLAGPSVHDGDRLWEYAVLVTDVAYPLEAIGQLYRDRADAENAFDELKNQWGLGGFTTQDINRCQTVARSCALVFNWWSWYCRAANPGGRLEAITSRPLLLAAVGKAASHANQTTLYLTPLHGRADILKRLIANIGAALQHVRAAAEQFKTIDPWGCMLRYISDRIAPVIGPPKPPPALQATG